MSNKKKINFYAAITIAAMLIILVIFAIGGSLGGSKHKAIFDSHFYPIQAPNVMQNDGSPEGQLWVKAIEAYKAKNYSIAREKFAALRESAPKQMNMLDLYYAISCLGDRKPYLEEATTHITHIYEQGASYVEQAEWYLALCYLKDGKLNKSKSLLKNIQSNENHIHFGETRKLLSELMELE